MGDLTKNLSRSEFACKCGCGLDAIDPDFVSCLQWIRDKAGFPLLILSGCRCSHYNASLKGGPAHTPDADSLCKAADVLASDSRTMDRLIALSYMAGIRRRGVNNGALHLDMRRDLPQDVTWTYYKKKGEK